MTSSGRRPRSSARAGCRCCSTRTSAGAAPATSPARSPGWKRPRRRAGRLQPAPAGSGAVQRRRRARPRPRRFARPGARGPRRPRWPAGHGPLRGPGRRRLRRCAGRGGGPAGGRRGRDLAARPGRPAAPVPAGPARGDADLRGLPGPGPQVSASQLQQWGYRGLRAVPPLLLRPHAPSRARRRPGTDRRPGADRGHRADRRSELTGTAPLTRTARPCPQGCERRENPERKQ